VQVASNTQARWIRIGQVSAKPGIVYHKRSSSAERFLL
jgi:hypothetical protein